MTPPELALDIGEYQYGFHDPERPVFKTRVGLDEDVVREISAHKGEPQWMLDFRLKALKTFLSKPRPTWCPMCSLPRSAIAAATTRPAPMPGPGYTGSPPR